ncbi:MAG: tRNA pseudouridine(13) synthase TruD [Planctomycetota bacterium]
MKIKQIPDDFQVDEAVDLALDEEGRHAVYLMEKRSRNTLDVVADLARIGGVPRDDVGFAGLKDRHAVTRQHVSIPGGPGETVRGKGFTARFLGRSRRPVSAEILNGNAFRIRVRDLTRRQVERFTEGLRCAARDGVPNYFDEQRFGSARHGRGFIAERMARGDFESALRLFMAYPARKDSARRKATCRAVSAHWGDWAHLAEHLPPGTERRIASHLLRRPGDFKGALQRIDRQRLSLFLHAWQGYLWNRIASTVLDATEGVRGPFPRPYRFGRFLFYNGLEDAARETLSTFSLPFPAPSIDFTSEAERGAVERVFDEEKLTVSDFRLPGLRVFFKGGRRPLLVFPADLHVGNPQPDDRNPGRRFLRFSMALPPGSYATIVIKRASVFS